MKKYISITLIALGLYLTAYSTTRIQTPDQLASTENLTEFVQERAKPGEALTLFSIGLGFFTIGFLVVKTKG